MEVNLDCRPLSVAATAASLLLANMPPGLNSSAASPAAALIYRKKASPKENTLYVSSALTREQKKDTFGFLRKNRFDIG